MNRINQKSWKQSNRNHFNICVASEWVWPCSAMYNSSDLHRRHWLWLCYIPEHSKLLLWPTLLLNRPEDKSIIHVSRNSFLKHGILNVNQTHTLSPENRVFTVTRQIARKTSRGLWNGGLVQVGLHHVGAVRPWAVFHLPVRERHLHRGSPSSYQSRVRWGWDKLMRVRML